VPHGPRISTPHAQTQAHRLAPFRVIDFQGHSALAVRPLFAYARATDYNPRVPSEKENAAERFERIERLLRELTKHTDSLHEEVRVMHEEQKAAYTEGRARLAKDAKKRAQARATRQSARRRPRR